MVGKYKYYNEYIVFPVLNAGKHSKISAEIVMENIPLLLKELRNCI